MSDPTSLEQEADALDAQYGKELYRYLDAHGRLRSVRDSGVTLIQTWDNRTWRVGFRIPAGLDPELWREHKRLQYLEQPAWAKKVKELPSPSQLEDWLHDTECETITGERVEHDGIGKDGAPSWLLILGLV